MGVGWGVGVAVRKGVAVGVGGGTVIGSGVGSGVGIGVVVASGVGDGTSAGPSVAVGMAVTIGTAVGCSTAGGACGASEPQAASNPARISDKTQKHSKCQAEKVIERFTPFRGRTWWLAASLAMAWRLLGPGSVMTLGVGCWECHFARMTVSRALFREQQEHYHCLSYCKVPVGAYQLISPA